MHSLGSFRQSIVSATLSVWLYALFPLASDVILSKQIGFLFMGVLFLILDVDFANQFLTTYNLK